MLVTTPDGDVAAMPTLAAWLCPSMVMTLPPEPDTIAEFAPDRTKPSAAVGTSKVTGPPVAVSAMFALMVIGKCSSPAGGAPVVPWMISGAPASIVPPTTSMVVLRTALEPITCSARVTVWKAHPSAAEMLPVPVASLPKTGST